MYDKFYQNIFPASAVSVDGTTVSLSGYNHETDRRNLFNQTDLTYKLDTGMVRQTFLVGSELSHQSGIDVRRDAFFNGTALTITELLPNSASFVPAVFRYNGGANSNYRLDVAAAYAQDQIEVTKYLQFIGGLRFDHFDYTSTNMGTTSTTLGPFRP